MLLEIQVITYGTPLGNAKINMQFRLLWVFRFTFLEWLLKISTTYAHLVPVLLEFII